MWHEGSLKETRLKEEKVEHWKKEKKNCHSGDKSLARWAEWASEKLGSMDCVLSAPMPMSEPGRRGVMCLRVKRKWAVRGEQISDSLKQRFVEQWCKSRQQQSDGEAAAVIMRDTLFDFLGKAQWGEKDRISYQTRLRPLFPPPISS